jgi:hypothetical protein
VYIETKMNAKELNAIVAQAVANALAKFTVPTPEVEDDDFIDVEATVSQPRAVSHMAAGTATATEDDPNIVRINITQGYIDSRLTLPREVYLKSNRDATQKDGNNVVVVDGVAYPQTVNQGRSSKIQARTFNVTTAGQQLVLTRIKGNQWASVVKGKGNAVAKTVSAPAKKAPVQLGKKVAAPVPAKAGKSAGRFQVTPPAKAKAVAVPKPVSKGKTQEAGIPDVQTALRTAVKQITANAEAGTINTAIQNASEKRGDEPTPRMYLTTAENRALKAAMENAGSNILAADKPLRKHFNW